MQAAAGILAAGLAKRLGLALGRTAAGGGLGCLALGP